MLYSEHYIQNAINSKIPINKKFVNWINRVEQIVCEKLKLDLLDIPDEDYMEMFENKMSSYEVAEYVIKQNM